MKEKMEHKGHWFLVEVERDEDMGEPWKVHDGHGVISQWTCRNKLPGERVLVEDRGSRRYYDIEATMKRAKRDGWGLDAKDTEDLTKKLGRAPTKGEIIAEAVEQDYQRMKAWCNDDWYWVYVKVTLLDVGGKKTEFRNSLGGIDGDDQEDYLKEVAEELADECIDEAEAVDYFNQPTYKNIIEELAVRAHEAGIRVADEEMQQKAVDNLRGVVVK